MLSSSSSSSLVLHNSISPPISHRNRKLDNRGFKSSDSSEPTFLLPSKHTPLLLSSRALTAAIPIATSISVLLWTSPVNAGFLSGSSGLESVPIPQLPEIDFLKKWNDENQKKYAEFDSRFRSSTVLKELLEKSKLNKERVRLVQRLKWFGHLGRRSGRGVPPFWLNRDHESNPAVRVRGWLITNFTPSSLRPNALSLCSTSNHSFTHRSSAVQQRLSVTITNKREIQDKYCLRGAEWGVGDCSTQGMTQEERDAFIETLKKKIKG